CAASTTPSGRRSGRRRRACSSGSGGCGTCAWPSVSRLRFLGLHEPRQSFGSDAYRGELVGRQLLEAAREPRGAAGANPTQGALALLGQREADAAVVLLARRPCDEAVTLEPGDALRHRGGGDALVCSEPSDGNAACVVDRDEETDLVGRDTSDSLAAQLTSEAEQGRTEAGGDRHRRQLLCRRLWHSLTRLAKVANPANG